MLHTEIHLEFVNLVLSVPKFLQYTTELALLHPSLFASKSSNLSRGSYLWSQTGSKIFRPDVLTTNEHLDFSPEGRRGDIVSHSILADESLGPLPVRLRFVQEVYNIELVWELLLQGVEFLTE